MGREGRRTCQEWDVAEGFRRKMVAAKRKRVSYRFVGTSGERVIDGAQSGPSLSATHVSKQFIVSALQRVLLR